MNEINYVPDSLKDEYYYSLRNSGHLSRGSGKGSSRSRDRGGSRGYGGQNRGRYGNDREDRSRYRSSFMGRGGRNNDRGDRDDRW